MSINELAGLLLENLAETTWLEAVAVFTGLLSVWYARKASIWVYPTGIVSVLIYVYLCFVTGLYADMGINFYYFLMSVYGWYKWSRRDESDHLRPITACNPSMHLWAILLTLGSFIVLQYILRNFTDSTVPYWDSFTTAVFITGMWLMALKKIEHWIYWIIGDAVSVPLYFHKHLVLTSLQFTIFLILATAGYIQWKRLIRQTEKKGA